MNKNPSAWITGALFGWPVTCLLIAAVIIIRFHIPANDTHQELLFELATAISTGLTYVIGALLQRFTDSLSECKTTFTRLFWMLFSSFGLRLWFVCSIGGALIIWLVLRCYPVPVWELTKTARAMLYLILSLGSGLVAIMIIWLPRKVVPGSTVERVEPSDR